MYFIPEISTMLNRNKITRHGFLLIKVMTFCSTALACIHRSHISRQCVFFTLNNIILCKVKNMSLVFVYASNHTCTYNKFPHTYIIRYT